MNYFDNMCAITGYSPITTLWVDFTHIDHTNSIDMIKKFYLFVFNQYKNSYKEFTELVMILNWKSWYHHDIGRADFSEAYADLFYLAYNYGIKYFKDDELKYFWRTLD